MFEAYKIGVSISLVNHVSSGLLALSRDFGKTEADIAALQKRLHSITAMATTGFAAMAVGGGGLALMFKKPLEAAKDYETQLMKIRALNYGDAITSKFDIAARSANINGVSATDMLKSYGKAVGFFGGRDASGKPHLDEVFQLAPRIAQVNQAIGALYDGKVDGIDDKAVQAIGKYLDRRGATKTAGTFNNAMDLMVRLMTGSGGTIHTSDLDKFSQLGGTAFRSLSNEGLANMAALIIEQGGSRAGTSMMSVYQNLVAGRTPVKTMHVLEDLGLGHVGQKHGKSYLYGVKDEGTLRTDPVKWFMTTAMDAMRSHGIKDDTSILKTVNDMLSMRTASGMASIITTQQFQVLRDAANVRGAMGTDALLGAWKKTPMQQLNDLQARWNDLMTNLGITIMPMVIPLLEKAVTFLRWLSTSVRENPTLFKVLGIFFGSIFALTAVGGSLLVLNAGLRGLGLVIGGFGGSGLGGVGGIALLTTRLGAFGLAIAAVGATVAGMTWLLNKVADDPKGKTDPLNHPGMRWIKQGGRGAGGHWEVDSTLSQEHAGQHYVRLGRAGYWANDAKRDFVRPGGHLGDEFVKVEATVKVGESQLMKVVTNGLAKRANRPTAGISSNDASMSLPPVSIGGSK